jgi:hypothetical protein
MAGATAGFGWGGRCPNAAVVSMGFLQVFDFIENS